MKEAAVETTHLADLEVIDDSPQLLYRPIAEQLTPDTIPFSMKPQYITPDEAVALLDAADNYENFRPRKRTPARKRHWLTLMQTGRFVEFQADGPICMSPDGILLNGGNRLGALIEYGNPVGFIVMENVPIWMSRFFDTGNSRSLSEHMFMTKKNIRPGTAQTTRLGMRYEEFLHNKRSAYGWADWSRQKDQHVDIDSWMDRREYVLDFIDRGKALGKATNLQDAAGTAFIAYQQLAWPEGTAELEAYLDALLYGAMVAKGNPALTLREWGKRDGYIGNGTHGRREGHLLLLFKMFESFVNQNEITKVLVARGLSMHRPYHPKGPAVATANVLKALAKLDREAGKK